MLGVLLSLQEKREKAILTGQMLDLVDADEEEVEKAAEKIEEEEEERELEADLSGRQAAAREKEVNSLSKLSLNASETKG